jgi:hypothetical protein
MALLLSACRGEQGSMFVEVTVDLGLPVPSAAWPDGTYQIPEISTGGVGLFDFDADGDLDLYIVCHPPPGRPQDPAPNRLFAQEGGSFAEVPDAAGLADPGHASGVAFGDADGDGSVDVYVANIGPDALYLNDGRGRFRDATAACGIREDAWSSSAAFLDYDRDGDLDLFVSRYLADDPSRVCRTGAAEARDYCGPSRYSSVPDVLYRNHGGGRFEDVTSSAGLGRAMPGLGVACVDLTGDGWVDIFVANDKKPNQLWVNRGDGTFRDEALDRGVALSGGGEAQASMGVACGDVDGDGALDLLVTNLADEPHTLYLSGGGRGVFRDRSASSGLGAATLASTGWGAGFADFDHDGDLDLALVGGRISRGPVHPAAASGAFWSPYAEPNLVFLQEAPGRFANASARGGGFTARAEVSHGLAFGDIDGDGDVDLVESLIDNSVRVYRNIAPPAGSHWLRVRALTGRREALGALVTLTAAGLRRVAPVLSAYSFASASEPVAHFGLGTTARVDAVEVLWPDGKMERFAPPPGVDRTVTVRQGEGRR